MLSFATAYARLLITNMRATGLPITRGADGVYNQDGQWVPKTIITFLREQGVIQKVRGRQEWVLK